MNTHIGHRTKYNRVTCAGVEWIDDDRLMLASDRAKADQPYICTPRDQSVHIMVLPHGHRKVEGLLTEGTTAANAARALSL